MRPPHHTSQPANEGFASILISGAAGLSLLNSVDADGIPVLHVTTRRPGTIIRRDVGRGLERFELTDVQMSDGMYVAEPMDRYL